MSAPAPLGRIITFYSYKGGTGRSMGLANLAWILACCGRRVLVIDWDLEAPGLHRYFRPFLIDSELSSSEGLMDMVDNYASQAIRPVEPGATPDPKWYLEYADFSDYLLSINFDHFGEGGKIDLLPAGRQCDAYALTVSSFNWQNFYDRLGGGGFFEAFKANARGRYDYILIDSRTGVSDTAGICSVQMPDTLVVCFTYNNQSITGAAAVAESARKTRAKLTEERLERSGAKCDVAEGEAAPTVVEDSERPYRVFPVPMRVDSGESERLALRQAFARESFAAVLGHLPPSEVAEYWSSVEVPHKVFYSYEEVLAPFKDNPLDPKTVLAAFVRLARFVTDRDVTELVFPVSPELKRQYLDAFARTPGADAPVTRAPSAVGQETEVEALVRRAEAVLVRLDDATKRQARRALLRLVRVGRNEEGGGTFPIRTSLGDFDEAERRVLVRFADAGLVTITTEDDRAVERAAAGGSASRTVGLADERLLRAWKTLVGWIEADRDFLLWRQQVRAYLVSWERHERDPGTLLGGSLLNEALVWKSKRAGDLNPAEREYLDASVGAASTKALDPQAYRSTPGLYFEVAPAGVAVPMAASPVAPPTPETRPTPMLGSPTARPTPAPVETISRLPPRRRAAMAGAVLAGCFVAAGLAVIVLAPHTGAKLPHPPMGETGPQAGTDAGQRPPPSNASERQQMIDDALKDGDRALAEGNAPKALLAFTKAAEMGQDSSAVQRRLGRAYDALGRGNDAERAYSRAVALAPRDPVAYFERGKSRGLRQDDDSALEDFDHAISLDRDQSEYFLSRGVTLDHLGKVTRAIADYARAIELEPSDPRAYYARASLLEKTDKKKAAADYRSVLALPGGDSNLRIVAQVRLDGLTAGGGRDAAGPKTGQRVFLQYSGTDDRQSVQEIARALAAALKPIAVSEPQLVSAPGPGAVRYFFAGDAELAQKVKAAAEQILAERGVKVGLPLQNLGTTQRFPNARKETVELWLPPLGPAPARTPLDGALKKISSPRPFIPRNKSAGDDDILNGL